MKKVLFLSSALVMTMCSAFADDTATPDKKITGGAGTCTVDVLGVSDNNATANTIAVWSINEYTLAPGEYLSVTETSVDKTTCPAGSYCVGGAGFTVDNAATSIEQCPTEYPNSAAGAGAQNQCYTACTVATANIAHATAVSGNDYFGDGADACYATACDTGYHVDGGGFELLEKTPLINADYLIDGTTRNYVAIEHDGTVRYEGLPEDTLNSIGTWAADLDYGTIYGRASCQPTPEMSPENIHQNIFNWTEDIAEGVHSIEELKAYMEYELGQQQANKVIYLVTMLLEFYNKEEKGEEINIADAERFEKLSYALIMTEYNSNYDINSVGGGCYCQMDGFKPSDGEKNTVMSAPWVFYKDFGTDEFSYTQCASNCASYCGRNLGIDGNEYHRASVFGVLNATEKLATCEANTINIDWNPDNGGEHTKNMCTYDGEVTLPTPDPVKPGYTFTGWKLVETTTTTE